MSMPGGSGAAFHRATTPRRFTVAPSAGEVMSALRNVVGERRSPHDLLALDRLSREGVSAFGKRALNSAKGTSLERRLVALGEELGQPPIPQPAPRVDVDDHPSVRVGDRHRVPGLAVEEELQARVTVGPVDLDDQRRRVELHGLRPCAARPIARKGRSCQDDQREAAAQAAMSFGRLVIAPPFVDRRPP